MSLLALVADKGSPGVTTGAVALASVWPQQALLAECDPSGADVPYWLPGPGGNPLVRGRGLVSLAGAVRGPIEPGLVWEHTQDLDGGLPVLVGPAGPEQSEAMGSAWTPISGLLAGLPDTDVIADCGRVLGNGPAVPVLRRAGLIIVLARDTVCGVAHLRHGLGSIAQTVNASGSSANGSALSRMAVVMIAERRQAERSCEQVRQVLSEAVGLGSVPVVGALHFDVEGAAGLSGQWTKRLNRSALMKSARPLATYLHSWLVQTRPEPAAQSPASLAVPVPVVPRRRHAGRAGEQ